MIRIVRFGNVCACAAAAMPTTVSKAISQRFTCKKPVMTYSTIPLELDAGILHDLFPARNFLAQKTSELVRRAANRIDADGRDLPGKFRVFERASGFGIEFLHDVVRRALGDDDPDPCGDAKTRQAGLVQRWNIGSDLGTAQAGLYQRRQAVVAN